MGNSNKEYKIITEEEAKERLNMPLAIEVMRKAYFEKASKNLNSPPKIKIPAPEGSLCITAGVATGSINAIGFRVYDIIRQDYTNQPQFTAVYDSITGRFKGVVFSQELGAYRTAALNAVAMEAMARPDAKILGIIGTGYQARFHLEAAVTVKEFDKILVYGRTPENTKLFVKEMEAKLNCKLIIKEDLQLLVNEAEVIISTTRSAEPLFPASWVNAGTHLNTIGPKFKGRCEFDPQFGTKASIIASDSLEQIEAYGEGFFIAAEQRSRVVDVAGLIYSKPVFKRNPEDISLFCSVGLAGTEVLLANALLDE